MSAHDAEVLYYATTSPTHFFASAVSRSAVALPLACLGLVSSDAQHTLTQPTRSAAWANVRTNMPKSEYYSA